MPKRPKYSLDAKRNFAAAMRAQPTNAEAAMWEYLRADETGFRFRRQITLMGYIVDFYCPSLRIAIEVDGSVHLNEEIAAKDAEKERALEARGIKVLRFDNEDVLHFRRPVLMRIQTECERRGRLKGLVRGATGAEPNPNSSHSSGPNNPPETNAKRHNSSVSNGFPTKNGAQNLCTTPADVAQLPENQRITPEQYEKLLSKIVTLSRQRSMTFGLPPDERSTLEKVADLRYRFAELQARKARA